MCALSKRQSLLLTTASFIYSSAVILVITSVAKFISAVGGDAKYLSLPDPITGIHFRSLMLAVGVAELLVALICLLRGLQNLKLLLIGSLATNFTLYRLGLWWMGWKKPCSCLGNLTDALHLSPQVADTIMKGILAYLLIGSYGLLFWQLRREKLQLRVAAPPCAA